MKYILSLFLFLTAFTGFAQIPTPKKNTYVNDFAKVLSKKDIANINKSINKIEKATGDEYDDDDETAFEITLNKTDGDVVAPVEKVFWRDV